MSTDDRYADAVQRIFDRPGDIVLAAPLGLGKPNRLINAIYARAKAEPARRLTILTALSLTPPSPSSDIERRFLQPFLDRHFGADYPVLDYVRDQLAERVPDNITVHEFYLQGGAMLGCAATQQEYTSLNYTHVSRAVASYGVTVMVQLLARDEASGRLSLSCNPDVTADLLEAIAARGLKRPLLLAEVHPDLPFMPGNAEIPRAEIDVLFEPEQHPHQLFALPRQPVSDAEYAIGFLASTLVRDGGTLQIGIGALSDALTHALVLRQTRNSVYRQIVQALWPQVAESALVCEWGGLGEFEQGLFGASEMVMDGFVHLVEAGVIKRRVLDDVALMQRQASHASDEHDQARLASEGQYLHGGFFLGSKQLYRWLRELSPAQQRAIGMTRISHINELYGGNETLERLQRREARFFNTCMMTTLFGAAVSDALEDGRVVSGVGGQYNFVAMAHALRESRSVLMFRALRETPAGAQSSVLYNYGHVTIPRHLRDVAVTEYGVADLRDRSDSDCAAAMLAVADARFQPALRAQAIASRKLHAGRDVLRPANTPQRIGDALAPFRRDGSLPDYPLGCDFTEVEQRLVRALGWLRQSTASTGAKLRLILAAWRNPAALADREALQRMQLQTPTSFKTRLLARLVGHALHCTRKP